MSLKTENIIVLENASIYLLDNEFMELVEQLSQYDIYLKLLKAMHQKQLYMILVFLLAKISLSL
jgi:hypothetical protein